MAARKCSKCGKGLTPEQAGAPCPACGNTVINISDSDQVFASEQFAVAKELARMHFQVEAGLTRVFLITDKADVDRSGSIKLLEVNEYTAPSRIMPLHFGPAPEIGILRPSVIVEVTPDEFEQLQSNELKLPEGWEIGQELLKPSDDTGGA